MAILRGDCAWYVYREDGSYAGTFYLPETLTPEEAKARIVNTGDFPDTIEVRKAPDATKESEAGA